MRIAVLSTLASGGAATAAWRLTRALADFGHECSFFVLEGSGNPLRVPLLDNEDAFWTPALFRRWSSLTTPEALAAHATELFSDTITASNVSSPLPAAIREAEVVHLHWVAGMLFSPALLSAIAGKKVVWTLHDENAFTGGCHYAGACRNFQSYCRDCPLLKKSGPDDASARCFGLKEQLYPLLIPSLVTPSAWLAEKVKASALLRNYSVTNIPNPLDMEDFRPSQDRQALRKELNLPEDGFVILAGCEHLGNPRKHTKTLFEAFALLAAQSPDIPVVIMLYGYGQPPELGFPVHHFGYVDDEARMAELYGAADIFVHTSLQDNLPLTLCEAQTCGTPTLSFAVGGCPETMLPEETGFLVSETTGQALAERLRVIITDRGNLASMRDAARAFAEKRFDPKEIAAAYTEVFEKTQTVPGLAVGGPLFAGLMENQLASLATFFHDASKEQTAQHEALRQHHEARLVEQAAQLEALRQHHEARLVEQAAQLEALRQHHEARFVGQAAQLDDLERRYEARFVEQAAQFDDLGRRHEARFAEQTAQLETLGQRHEALRQRLDSLRWNLRHPFRWFFRKLRAKLRSGNIQG